MSSVPDLDWMEGTPVPLGGDPADPFEDSDYSVYGEIVRIEKVAREMVAKQEKENHP